MTILLNENSTNIPAFREPLFVGFYLSSQNAGATGLLNLLFSSLREPSRLHDDGTLRQETFAENLEVAMLDNIDDRRFLLLVLVFIQQIFLCLSLNERPQKIDVYCRLVVVVLPNVEISHTNFAEVAGMVFVEHNSEISTQPR